MVLPFRLAALALACLLALPAAAQPKDESDFALEFLDHLQIRSIVEDREYCGYFGRSETGAILATRPRQGKYNSCYLGAPPPGMRVFASYHTHASFDPGSYNEIPSPQDLRTDIGTDVDGYISTPGGRLWFSDRKAREVRQVCGVGCLAQDPAFRPGKFMKVRRRYTLDDLEWIMGEP